MTCPVEVQPLNQSEPIRTPQLSNLNYTNQDFFALKTRLRDLIKEKFPNDFNDFIESSLAIMLMEIWAFVGDTLSFKMDQIANEVFIDTVSEVENAFRLAKLVGFQPTPPIAARALFSATITNVLSTDLTIPGGLSIDVISENTPVIYELFPTDSNNNPIFDEDIVIPAGLLVNAAIIGVEGRTTTDTFTGTGLANQNYLLTNSPVIFDSIRVSVDGLRWQRFDFFSDSQPKREFRVEFTSDYQAFIIFGNNKTGLIPSNGSQIDVTYRVGGGTVGNIITGFIDTQQNVELVGFDFSIPVAFRNYTRGEFGYNGDGIEDIRNKLPAFLRTQDRAVSGSDYKTLADLFITPFQGQIGKSTAVLRNFGCAANVIDLYVLAKNGINGLQIASDDLKASLSAEINEKKMLTDFVCIRDGIIILVDIAIDISIDKFFKKLKEEINVRVLNKVSEFFALSNWEYGQTLKDTDLIKTLSEIRELKNIDITFTTNDPDNSGDIVSAKFNEIIRSDTISINFAFE